MTQGQGESGVADEEAETVEYVARRFTLTEDVIQRLKALADEAHGGNESACVRHAIQALDRRRDEGELRHNLRRLEAEIEALADQISSLQDEVQSPTHSQNPFTDPGVGDESIAGHARNGSEQQSSALAAREVRDYLKRRDDDVVPLKDILAEVDAQNSDIQDGLDELSDRNLVERDDTDDAIRYRHLNQ